MAGTLYTSLQYRLVTADTLKAEMPSQAQLIASGAVRVDANPPFKSQGGIYFEVPQFFEITGADVVPSADTDGTKYAITSFKDKGPICAREYIVAVENSAKLALGGDPIGPEILSQVPGYWAKRTQVALYNVLSGAFASGGAMDSSTYFYTAPGTTMSGASAASIMGLGSVGDTWGEYTIWVVHSRQYGQLVDAGQVQFLQAGAFGERTLLTGLVPTFLGKQIVVDDNIVDATGETYLLKPGAFYLGFQSDASVEYQRLGTFAGGTDAYAMRAAFMPHLTGLVYAGAAKPTNGTLATAGSWTLSQTTDYKLNKAIKVTFANS
jgi:hypothetical protein